MIPDFPQRFAQRLQQPLEQRAMQRRFAPELSYGRQFGPPSSSVRQAAVLVLFYSDENRWYLPLTLRPANMLWHPDQVSLPGGSLQPGESSVDAARREFEEELGASVTIDMLGQLSEIYLFVSDYCVTPWVGVTRDRPRWKPNPEEVAEILEISLEDLVRQTGEERLMFTRGPVTFSALCLRWGEYRIWGATCMILGQLMHLIQETGL
jgi:8-oxo-dGTP pyrophosphatase MutT (NUDIX family)